MILAFNSCDAWESPNVVIIDPISPSHRWGDWGLPLGGFARGNMVPWPSTLKLEGWRGAGSPPLGQQRALLTPFGEALGRRPLERFPTEDSGHGNELYSLPRSVTLSTFLTSLGLRLPIWKKTRLPTAISSWIPNICWRFYRMVLHMTYLILWRTLWNDENMSLR